MINFIYLLYFTMRCPDSWSKIILGVSVRVFLDEISIWIGGLRKADGPPPCGEAPNNLLKAWVLNRKANSTLLPAREAVCSLTAKLRYWPFPAFGLELNPRLLWDLELASFRSGTCTITFPDSQASDLGLGQVCLCVQLTRYGSWGFSASIIV